LILCAEIMDIQSILKVQGSNLDIVALMERARRVRVDRRLRALLAKTTLPGGTDA